MKHDFLKVLQQRCWFKSKPS